MAFLTALLGAAGGFQQGRQQRRDYELERQRQSDTHDYEQSEIAAENARTAQSAQEAADQRRLNSLDPVTGLPIQYKPGPNEQVAPHNGGVAPDDATAAKMHIALLYTKAHNARMQGDYRDADAWLQQAQQEALDTQRFANADYTLKGKLPQAEAQARLNDARAKAAGTAQATALQIAGINNAGRLQAAQIQAGSRETVARLSDGTRLQVAGLDDASRQAVARLAGAYRLRGYDAEGAWRAALGKYAGDVRLYQSQVKDNPDATVPTFQPPQPIDINVNVPTGGTVPGGSPIDNAPPGLGSPGVINPAGKLLVPGQDPHAAVAHPLPAAPQGVVGQYVAMAKHAFALGADMQKVRVILAGLVTSGKLTKAQADQVLRQSTPTSGGGF